MKSMTLAMLTAVFLLGAAPEGWHLAGNKPGDYDTGVDTKMLYNTRPSAFLKAKNDSSGFGTLLQSFKAEKYVGKRVRLSAWIKAEGVTGWSGLWMRIDGPGSPPAQLGFDNMQGRPIKGTIEWRRYEVVLDVNEKAISIYYGILLGGAGQVWMNSVEFEEVSSSVPTTGSSSQTAPDGPRNLSFDK